MTPGPTQLIIVLVIVLLLFGAKKIPELAKGLGTGMREFRKGASGEIEDEKTDKGQNADETSSTTREETHSDDEITYASDEEKAQNADEASKTEQRS